MNGLDDAPTPVIRRPVAFEEKHHIQAESTLRRRGLFWLQIIRATVLLGLLAAWLWVGELAYEDASGPFHPPAHTFHQMLWGFIPYGFWFPLAVLAWYRMRLAARRSWLHRAIASGVHTVEYGADGVTYCSDSVRHFYQWNSFFNVVNRRDVIILRLNRAAAILMPKIDTTSADAQRIMQWYGDYRSDQVPPRETLPVEPPVISLTTQLDYRDFLEANRMERRANAKVSIIVLRWVRVGVGFLVFLAFLALGVQGYIHHVPRFYWYWITFGVPLFLILIYAWAWTFLALSRRQVWRIVKPTIGRSQEIRLHDGGLDVRSPSSVSHYAWSAFNNVAIGQRVLSIGVIGGAPVVIPRRQIPGDESECIAFLQHHVINVTQAFPVEMPILRHGTN